MSITAYDWVAQSCVDPGVLERWPDYRVILVAADDVDVDQLAAVTEAMFDQAVTDARTIDRTALRRRPLHTQVVTC